MNIIVLNRNDCICRALYFKVFFDAEDYFVEETTLFKIKF